MAIGLSTSGTLFGYRAAEDTIRRLQGRSVQTLSQPETAALCSALSTLLRATAGGSYRPPADILRFLGDTATHEVGH